MCLHCSRARQSLVLCGWAAALIITVLTKRESDHLNENTVVMYMES